jgi:hypothetical protein
LILAVFFHPERKQAVPEAEPALAG